MTYGFRGQILLGFATFRVSIGTVLVMLEGSTEFQICNTSQKT